MPGKGFEMGNKSGQKVSSTLGPSLEGWVGAPNCIAPCVHGSHGTSSAHKPLFPCGPPA